LSNSNKAIKAGIGYTIGNYLLKGLSFFAIPIFSRLMSTSDYGTYNTFAAYESIIFVIIGLALHSSFKNAKYKYSNKFQDYISTCVTVGLISFFSWCVLANVLYVKYKSYIGFSRVVVNLLLICSMGSAIVQYFNVYVGIDYKYDRFLKISAFNAVSSILLSAVLILLFFKDNSYMGRIIGTTVPLLLISVYIVIDFYKKAKPQLNAEYAKYAIKFSLPIIPHGLSQVVLSQFDRIMINTIIGAAQAGLYSFSYNIYTIIQVTASSLDNVWGPWFFEKAKQNKYGTIKKVSGDYMTGMMLFSSVVLLVSPEVIKLIAPKAYWESVYCVIPIVIAGYFSFLYTLPVQVEYYFEKTKFIALGTGSAAIINIILNSIFIPKYGYIAAAYTTLATYFLYFVFHFVFARMISKVSYFNIRILAFDVVTVLLVGAVTIMLLDKIFVRWFIVLVFFALGITYAQIHYGVINKIVERFDK
jgi:O-antigen/teichoic acid export membrane protein